MPLLGTRGAASAKAFGLTAGGASYYPYVGGTTALLNDAATYGQYLTTCAVDTDGTFYPSGWQRPGSGTWYAVWKYSNKGVALPFIYSSSQTYSDSRSIGVDSNYIYTVDSNLNIKVLNKSTLAQVSEARLTYGQGTYNRGVNIVQTSGGNLFGLGSDASWFKCSTSFTGAATLYYVTDGAGAYLYSSDYGVSSKNGKVYMIANVYSINLFYEIDVATNTISNMFSGTSFLALSDYTGAGGGYLNSISVTADANFLYVCVKPYGVYGKGYLLYKFNRSATPSGSLVWAKEYYYGYQTPSANPGLEVDASGNVYMAISWNNYIQVVKVDSSGNHLWTRTVTTSVPSTNFQNSTFLSVTSTSVLAVTNGQYGANGIFFVKLEPTSGSTTIPTQTVTYAGYNVDVTSPTPTVSSTTVLAQNYGGFYVASNSLSYTTPTYLTISSNSYYNANGVTPLAAV